MKQDIYSLALWRGIKLLWTQKRKKKYRLINISYTKNETPEIYFPWEQLFSH